MLEYKNFAENCEKQKKDFEQENVGKRVFENTGDKSKLSMLKNTLKTSEERNSTLIKKNEKLKDEGRKLIEDLSKFTKGKENLDKLLGKQKYPWTKLV